MKVRVCKVCRANQGWPGNPHMQNVILREAFV